MAKSLADQIADLVADSLADLMAVQIVNDRWQIADGNHQLGGRPYPLVLTHLFNDFPLFRRSGNRSPQIRIRQVKQDGDDIDVWTLSRVIIGQYVEAPKGKN